MSSLPNTLPRVKPGGEFPWTGYSLDKVHLQYLFPRGTIDTSRFRLDPTRRYYEINRRFFVIQIRNLLRGQQVLVKVRSLPRFISRSNLYCLSEADDIARALEGVAEAVSRALGIEFPIWGATLTHLEINRDHFLGDRLRPCFEALTRFRAPRLNRVFRPEDCLFPTSIYFENKSRGILFYLKREQLESKYSKRLPEFYRNFATGLLRCEIKLFGRVLYRFAEKFQNQKPSDRRARVLLTPEFLEYAFERMLYEARLDGEFLRWETFRRNARRRLRTAHPRMQDATLTTVFDVLRCTARFGEKHARATYSARTVRYAKAKLSRLGMWRLNFAPEDMPALACYPYDNPTPENTF